MDNIEYIKTNFNKNPTIMKALLKMEDIDYVDQKIIAHFLKIIQTNRIQQSNLKISYNDYNNFKLFYYSFIQWLSIVPVDISFHALNIKEKEKILGAYNIKYSNENGTLVIFPTTFEETCIVGSPKWCIVKSKNLWTSYNKNKQHMVIIKDNNIYGMSFDKKGFKCFNKSDMPVPYLVLKLKFKKIIKEYTKLYNPLDIFMKPLFIVLGFLALYVSTLFAVEAQYISLSNKPIAVLAIWFISFLYYKTKGLEANTTVLLTCMIFIAYDWGSTYITKERLHTIYQFETTLLDQENIIQQKQQAIFNGDWDSFKEFESDDTELTSLLINLIYKDDNSSYIHALIDKEIGKSFAEFSSTNQKLIYRELILNKDFEKLTLTYSLSENKELYQSFIIDTIIEKNSLDFCLTILQEKLIDPSLNNNALLRWATFNESADIVKELLKFKSVNEGIDKKWLDNYIINKDTWLGNLDHLL